MNLSRFLRGFDAVASDSHYAVQALARRPKFPIVVVLTIALGRVKEVEELRHEFNVSRATMSALAINGHRSWLQNGFTKTLSPLNSLARLVGEDCPPFSHSACQLVRGDAGKPGPDGRY